MGSSCVELDFHLGLNHDTDTAQSLDFSLVQFLAYFAVKLQGKTRIENKDQRKTT